MFLWSRIGNVFHTDRLNREIDEEIESHITEAIEQGRDTGELRRAVGSTLRQREESRDVKLIPWLDSLRADAVFRLAADQEKYGDFRGGCSVPRLQVKSQKAKGKSACVRAGCAFVR